jgi:hypothetical protein
MKIYATILQVLTGHKDNAEFALAMCSTEPFVLSGGWILSPFYCLVNVKEVKSLFCIDVCLLIMKFAGYQEQ